MQQQPQIMLKTPRLRFEAWQAGDAPLLLGLHADPRVQTGYAQDPEKWTRQGIDNRLREYMQEQEQFGHTKWKVLLHDGTFIGRAGWSPWGEGEIELGYAIRPEFWNKGYASEAALALTEWAQANCPDKTLIGFALLHNIGSRRVLEKIGMAFLDERSIDGMPYAYYNIAP